MKGLMLVMSCALADRADESLVAAAGIDADEVEDLSLVEVSLCAFQVAHAQLLDLIGFDTHQLIYIIDRPFPIVTHRQ